MLKITSLIKYIQQSNPLKKLAYHYIGIGNAISRYPSYENNSVYGTHQTSCQIVTFLLEELLVFPVFIMFCWVWFFWALIWIGQKISYTTNWWWILMTTVFREAVLFSDEARFPPTFPRSQIGCLDAMDQTVCCSCYHRCPLWEQINNSCYNSIYFRGACWRDK